MERKTYNWKQVVSYGLIALHNLLNSANEVNIKNMQMCFMSLYKNYILKKRQNNMQRFY